MATKSSSPTVRSSSPPSHGASQATITAQLKTRAGIRLAAAISVTMLGAILAAAVMPRGPVIPS